MPGFSLAINILFKTEIMKRQIVLALMMVCITLPALVLAQDAKKIIAKHIKAIGGYKKLTNEQMLHAIGVREGGAASAEIEMWQINNKGFRVDMKTADTTRSQIMYDGYRWIETNPGKKGKPNKLPEAVWKNTDLGLAGEIADYKSDSVKLTYSGKETVDGRECFKILLTNRAGRNTYYFIDTDTYYILQSMVVKIENGKETEMGTSRFGNHKRTKYGLIQPYLLMQVVNGKVVGSTRLSLIEINNPVDEAVFKMPESL